MCFEAILYLNRNSDIYAKFTAKFTANMFYLIQIKTRLSLL